MSGQVEWERLAQDLGVVLVKFLDEYENMCYGSDHKDEALVVVRRLSLLVGEADEASNGESRDN